MKDYKTVLHKADIYPIFPTGVYKNVLARPFSKSEIKFCLEQEKNKNKNNNYSKNIFVLNHVKLKQLKKDLEAHVENYFNIVVQTKNKIKPFITQSWLNYTTIDESHHGHFHPNSLVSGVLYIQTAAEDAINFNKEFETISLDPGTNNMFNSESYKLMVKERELVLFPSRLRHSVEVKKEKNLRVSLSFNVFIKGEIGVGHNLTQLTI
tara:strand:+ start:1405 stop:2028 length:624 start_codon:yes stop_codon:yes gene_type:complete